MRSAAECLAEAAQLSRIADRADDIELKALALALAEVWLNIGVMAEWRDALEPWMYLIQ